LKRFSHVPPGGHRSICNRYGDALGPMGQAWRPATILGEPGTDPTGRPGAW